MSKQLLILGAGTAGTMMANHLRRRLPAGEWRMTIVDRSAQHLYQPGFLFLPFGIYQESDVRFIDLEKLRKGISRERVRRHDLDQLVRHTSGWLDEDWHIFRAAYEQQRANLSR